MQVSEARMPSRPVASPNWVSWTLVAGSAILFVWGSYVLTFLSEPSAVGRLLVALVASILMTLSVVGAIAGIPALIGTLTGRDSDSN
jgi:hypothetical protein